MKLFRVPYKEGTRGRGQNEQKMIQRPFRVLSSPFQSKTTCVSVTVFLDLVLYRFSTVGNFDSLKSFPGVILLPTRRPRAPLCVSLVDSSGPSGGPGPSLRTHKG